MFLKLFLLYIFMQSRVTWSQKTYNIGVLLENRNQEFMYDYAADVVNRASTKLKLNLVKALVEPDNPFSALKGACSVLKHAVIAIFGPTSASNMDVVHSVCTAKLIPHVLTVPSRPAATSDLQYINFYPNLNKLFKFIIEHLNWQNFTLLYAHIDRVPWFQEYIDEARRAGLVVNLINLDLSPGDRIADFRLVIEEMTKFRQKNFILDCHAKDLTTILRQMRGLGMLTAGCKFLLTTLDADSNVLQSFSDSGAHIYKIELTHFINISLEDKNLVFPHINKSSTVVILNALLDLSLTLNIMNATPNPNMDCNNTEKWFGGVRCVKILDMQSKYRDFQVLLNIFKPNSIRWEIIGLWQYYTGTVVPEKSSMEKGNETQIVEDTSFMHFRVMTTLAAPYTMMRASSGKLSGNNQFEGYTIDLLDALSKIENFTYTIVIREDGRNGIYDPLTGGWTGIIQDLLEHRADLAVTDMTITSARETAVDFTVPFMHLGIGILFQKPLNSPPSFWYFARPFSKDMWWATAMAFVAVVLCLFVIGRFSPSEWQKTCNKSNYIINHLTLCNSLWLVTGGLFRQGTQVKVSSVPARILTGSWWCFCYVLIAVYTASLFYQLQLNEQEKAPLFTSWQDMVVNARDLGIQYGAKLGGSTAEFFKNSVDPFYQDVYRHMDEYREDMVPSIEQGIQRAKRSRYAMFMESSTIEYVASRHCDLEMYGGLLSQSAYGIAMRKESPYRHGLSTAILKLTASGELDRLKRRWWQDKNNGDACTRGENEKPDILPLDLLNLSGLFYITFIGLILAMLGGFLEFSYYIYKLSRRIKIPFCRTFTYEVKKCFTVNVKKVVDSNLIDTPILESECDPVSELIELS